MIDIVMIYLTVYASVLLHETAHFLAAKQLHIPVLEVKVGADWPQFRCGIWKLSPLFGISYVSAEYDQIVKLSARQKAFYFFAGIFINLLLAAVCGTVWLVSRRFFWFPAASVNLFSAVGNALPIGKTDAGTFLKLRNQHSPVTDKPSGKPQ